MEYKQVLYGNEMIVDNLEFYYDEKKKKKRKEKYHINKYLILLLIIINLKSIINRFTKERGK